MKIGYLMQEGAPDIRQVPPSGPAVHVIRVIKELNSLGHQVVLMAMFDNQIYLSKDLITFDLIKTDFLDYGPFRLFEKITRRIQYVLRLPYLNFFNGLRFAFACHRELSGCDLFYERFGWIGYGGWIAARLSKVPIIWELNGDHVTELASHGIPLRGIQKLVSFLLMRIVARRVDYTIATGEGWRQKHIIRWGIAPSKISVVENGSQVIDMLSKEELRSSQDISSGTEYVNIVYLGAFEKWHGIKVLIRAFASAVKSLPHLRLDLIGDGPERQNILQLIQANDLEDRVRLIGNLRLSEAVHYLKNADIGVSPYCGRAEYSGLKLLDYKSAGLAIIASGENGQPEVIKHRESGFIVPPCSEEALCEAIISLAVNISLRRKIGQQARCEAEQFHRWRHTAERIDHFFMKVLASQRNALD